LQKASDNLAPSIPATLSRVPAPVSHSAHEGLSTALDAVGDRWTMLIVALLLDGPQRFGDLQRALDGIAPNVLTARLRRLEERRLVVVEPYSHRPPRFTYELSASGRELAGALRLLAAWGSDHADGAGPHHAACGTALEATWFCPECEVAVASAEAEELDYA
jgi:DNA-binding HxlR family transcriptional regulator